jgi:hypothetical protein
MLTKRCCDCRQVKTVELFDRDPKRPGGRAAECKDCRRQRQARAGYATSRNRALWTLARRYRQEYERYRDQARKELAPDTATATVWDQARGRALAEISHRYRAEWDQHYQQVRQAHPDWNPVQASTAATAQQRRAHHAEYLELLNSHAGARRAGPKVIGKINRHALRRLQLAHPAEYHDLYATERANLGNPIQRPPGRSQRGGPAR